VIEREFTLSSQSWIWAGGYVALVILFFVCVGMVVKAPPMVQLPGAETKTEEKAEEKAAEAPAKKEAVATGITAKKPAGPNSLSSRMKKGRKQAPKGGKLIPTPTGPAREVRKPYVEVRSDVMTPWRRLRWVALAAVPSSLMLGIITYISTDVSAI